MHLHSLYGLTVAAAESLPGCRPAATDAAVDVTIRWGAPLDGNDAVLDGELLLTYGTTRPWYCAGRTREGGYVLRYHGSCDFLISPDLATVEVRTVAGSDRGIATILTTGGLLAFLLYVRGATVLHASAVQVGDAALAFVGYSGRGKSTMATLMCADGATVITDDVLRIDGGAADGRPLARLGKTEFRLRKGADTLLGQFGAGGPDGGRARPDVRISADERTVLHLGDGASDHLPLAAIVIPTPMRDGSPLSIDPMPKTEALHALLNMPRIQGWQDAAVITRHFGQLATLVQQVPVLSARIPWGPPFDPGIAAAVRAAAGL